MDVVGRCLVVVVAVLGAVVVDAATALAGPVPARFVQSVDLEPPSGPVRTAVDVRGSIVGRCLAARRISVTWDGREIATQLSFAVPAQAAEGWHSVTVSCVVEGPVVTDTDPPTTTEDPGGQVEFLGLQPDEVVSASARFLVEPVVVTTPPTPPTTTRPTTTTPTTTTTTTTGATTTTTSPAGAVVATTGGPTTTSSSDVEETAFVPPGVGLLLTLLGVLGVLALVVVRLLRDRRGRHGPASGLRLVAVRGPVTGPDVRTRR